jgi:two-component system, chemotaxis family, chemotaxis protein CheY
MAHRILIADDNEQLRHSFATILEEEGYSVVEASDGNEVLRNLDSSTEFDLLITDLVMPNVEGLELITLLKKSHPKLPIVVISGAFVQFLRAAKLLGAKETLQKPFNNAALLAAVQSALPNKVRLASWH